jgi:hypothetical protein
MEKQYTAPETFYSQTLKLQRFHCGVEQLRFAQCFLPHRMIGYIGFT